MIPATDFPPKVKPTPLYFHDGGKLEAAAPTAETGSTKYTSDPFVPMKIPGTSFPGARDASAFERQAEVRTFTTQPLKEAVEWTGRVKAELMVSSSTPDTDLLVRISDVYPDGRSILIVDYPIRARYREGFEKEVLMEPGQVYKVAWDIGWMSQMFNKGHCIRVTVSGTGSPLYEPNPQNGKPLTIAFPQDAKPALISIHHNRENASRILAPVRPIDR